MMACSAVRSFGRPCPLAWSHAHFALPWSIHSGDDRIRLLIPQLSGLSILQGGRFTLAPQKNSSNAPTLARIFDIMHTHYITADDIVGKIPLSYFYPSFTELRYWRLPRQIRSRCSWGVFGR